MPLIDINNPDIIKFLVENYERTARLRLRWQNIYADKLNKAAHLEREEKGYRDTDVFKAAMVSGMDATTRDNKSDAVNRRLKPIRDGLHIPGVADLRKEHSIVKLGLGDPTTDPRLARPDTDLTPDPIMRPVNPKQKEILYKGKPDFGRQQYLLERWRSAKPEERYYFAESSGWFYGWRLKESSFGKSAPKHGRVCRLAREGSRSGPHPDPSYYKSATAGRGRSKCEL